MTHARECTQDECFLHFGWPLRTRESGNVFNKLTRRHTSRHFTLVIVTYSVSFCVVTDHVSLTSRLRRMSIVTITNTKCEVDETWRHKGLVCTRKGPRLEIDVFKRGERIGLNLRCRRDFRADYKGSFVLVGEKFIRFRVEPLERILFSVKRNNFNTYGQKRRTLEVEVLS